MAQARPKNVSKDLFELPNSKWEYIIDNFIKSEIDRKIAKLYNIETKTSKEVIKERYSKAIYQIDPKTGEIIQKFNSRIEATAALRGEENKYKDYHICSVCDGKRKLALGYKWRYADEQ